jgi:hypothetical protein
MSELLNYHKSYKIYKLIAYYIFFIFGMFIATIQLTDTITWGYVV